MRPVRALLVAAALVSLPVFAAAETFAVAEVGATSEAIEATTLASLRTGYEGALRGTGMEVAPKGDRKAFATAEFVTSLTAEKVGGELVLTAQVSRMRVDRWAARAEVRVTSTEPAAMDEALSNLAGQISLAVRTAPPRAGGNPEARPHGPRLIQTKAIAVPTAAPASAPTAAAE